MYNDIVNSVILVTGYDKVQQATVINNYINRAAFDIYTMLEADALLREIVLQVPRDCQVTMPPYIGELRGMREYNWNGIIQLNEIGSPRYSSDTWKFKWHNWTLKGKKPIATSITNAGPLQFLAVGVENPPVQIQLTGRGQNSHKQTETIVMSATSVASVNSYLDIDEGGIACLITPRAYDIDVYDINSNQLATLYNNEPITEYTLVDVSAYPWMALQGDGTCGYVETLYKTKFYRMYNPTDVFMAPGFDDAIAYRAIAIWYSSKDGKDASVAQYNTLSKQVLDAAVNNSERGQVIKMAQGNNSTYRIFQRLRNSWGAGRRQGNYWPGTANWW